MRATLWGTRGSIAVAGPDTVKYGGDTASIEVRTANGRLLILDAGSGIRPIGGVTAGMEQVDILITHLHMDHVQGLPFFPPLLDPDVRVDIWGPISTTSTLRHRLARYLSPPLFPVRVRELRNVVFHDVPPGTFEIDSVEITADLVCHPGSTLGFRLEENGAVLTYIPDHEPALASVGFPGDPGWTSGHDLAIGASVLIHDSQYTQEEYDARVGWGHTSLGQLDGFVEMVGADRLVTFHHDPSHSDDRLDELHRELATDADGYAVIAGTAGKIIEI